MGKHARPGGASDAVPVVPWTAVQEPPLTRYPTTTGFTTAPPVLQPLCWDQPRNPRLRASQTTFGLFGRLVMTGVILLFAAWVAYTNFFFLIPAVPAVAWLLKDNWRKAPERRAPQPTQVADGPRAVARDPFAPLADEVVFDPRVTPPEDLRQA
ncbi:MAG: hypothetical protein AB7O74_08280 [Candidatus Nanopelagicales bacterium]